MAAAIPDFEAYLRKGQIEIVPHDKWHLSVGTFNGERVLNGLVEKLQQALVNGYCGLRLTGDAFCLESNGRRAFAEYEAEINNVISRYRMLAVCTYCLDKCNGADVVDVISNHKFALIKRGSSWDMVESTIYKQARQTLGESEKHYRNLFSNMTDAFALHELILDDQGRPCDYRFIEVNDAFARHTGLLPERIIGKTLREVLPDAEEYWIDTYGKAALTGNAISFENFSKPLGRWYEVSAYSPKRGYFATLFRDVTERKRIQDTLRQSEELYRSLVEATRLSVIRVDREGKRTFVQESILDRPESDSKEGRFGDSLSPGDRERAWKALQGVFETGKPVKGFMAKGVWNNKESYVISNYEPVRDAHGNVVEVKIAAYDVTEQVEAEKRNVRLANILRSLNDTKQLLPREHDKERLAQDVCNIIADIPDVGMVWMSLIDGPNSLVSVSDAVSDFRLVGLEAMAAGGIAYTGSTGEEYARSMENVVVLEAADADEIASYARYLNERPDKQRQIRQKAHTTAESFTWENIIQKKLLPKLEFLAWRKRLLDMAEERDLALTNSDVNMLAGQVLIEGQLGPSDQREYKVSAARPLAGAGAT